MSDNENGSGDHSAKPQLKSESVGHKSGDN